MAFFRYSTTVHSARGMTPYMVVLGIESFHNYAEAGGRMAINSDPQSQEELSKRFKTLHWEFPSNGVNARCTAANQYNKLVNGHEYIIGDRVMVFKPRNSMHKWINLKPHF